MSPTGGAEQGHSGAGPGGSKTLGGHRGGQRLCPSVHRPESAETTDPESPPWDCQNPEQESQRLDTNSHSTQRTEYDFFFNFFSELIVDSL